MMTGFEEEALKLTKD